MCEKIKYYVVCDYREKFSNYFQNGAVYNDHYKKDNIDDIVNSINRVGFRAEYFGGISELVKAVDKKQKFDDCVFLNFNDGLTQLHKRGQTPILLEILTNMYSGSDAFVSLLASDKFCTNHLLNSVANVRIPKSYLYDCSLQNYESFDINFPIIVKPNNEGSSIGIDCDSYCSCLSDLTRKLQQLKCQYNKLILEEYISGIEFTVFLLGNNSFPICQPLAIGLDNNYQLKKEIFDAEIKRNHRRTYCAPEKFLSFEKLGELKNISQTIFKCLGLRDYARLDFRYRNEKFYLLEVNTVPAIGRGSDVGEVCKLLDISFEEFIKILLQTVNERLFGL